MKRLLSGLLLFGMTMPVGAIHAQSTQQSDAYRAILGNPQHHGIGGSIMRDPPIASEMLERYSEEEARQRRALSTKGLGDQKDRQRTWIFTASVENYEKFGESAQLRFCDDDAQAFAARIREGNGVPVDRVRQLNSQAVLPEHQPTRNNIMRELTQFLSEPGANDTVMLFFSMHGVQATTEQTGGAPKTFLVAGNGDPNNVMDCLIDVDWLREQLQMTKAKTVLLFLDCCHAGSIHQSGTKQAMGPLSSRSVESIFKSQPISDSRRCIYVLSSCGSEQRSLETSEFRHGVFTYWLLCGLDGAADENNDTVITMDELYQFVDKHVPKSAAYFSKRSPKAFTQNPQRFLCGSDHGNAQVTVISPQPIGKAMNRLADVVHGMLTHHLPQIGDAKRLPRIGLVEFSILTPEHRKELRGPLGSFGYISKEELERRLVDKTGGDSENPPPYRVVAGDAVRRRMKNIELVQVQGGALPAVDNNDPASTLDGIVFGQFVRRGGTKADPSPDRLQLEVVLQDMRDNAKIARVTLPVLINPELWAMLGTTEQQPNDPLAASPQSPDQHLVSTQPDPQGTPINPNQGFANQGFANQGFASQGFAGQGFAGQGFAEQSSKPQPKPNTPQEPKPTQEPRPSSGTDPASFAGNDRPSAPTKHSEEIEIRVYQAQQNAGSMKPTSLRPIASNQFAFETQKGNRLRLDITNKTDRWLAFIVQIDGLNQIGGKALLPSESPYWISPPGSTAAVDQWLKTPAAVDRRAEGPNQIELKGNELVIVSPPDSLAGQQKLTEQLGEIRVLVYEIRQLPKGTRGSEKDTRSVGVGMGQERQNQFPVYKQTAIDVSRLVSRTVIRYREAPESPSVAKND